MKLFLDTADIEEIKRWKDTGLIDGVTTNPSHLAQTRENPTLKVREICRLLPKGDISVEVTETKPGAVYKQAKALAKLSKNIVVKIPCHIDYYHVIAKLAKDKIKVNVTLVFTLLQGLMMCKLGVKYISPFIGRWDDIDVDGAQLLCEMRTMIDEYGYQTQLLAASIRHVRHFHDAVLAGADVATLPVSVLQKATHHILTDQGIEKFNQDWRKLKITRFP